MNKKYVLNTVLPIVLGVVMLAMLLVQTFFPRIILPKLDIPMLVAISLVTLLVERRIAPNAPRCYICIPVFATLTFGLLGFAALLGIREALLLAVKGGVTFTATTWVYSSMLDRLSTGPNAKAAPYISAFGLYLTTQCLMGMF